MRPTTRPRLIGAVVNGDGDREQLVIGAIGVESAARCTACARALGFTEIVGERSRRLYGITWTCLTCGSVERMRKRGRS